MDAFTSTSNTMCHIDLTAKQGLSLLIRDSFCISADGWWVAGYATVISTTGCESHPVLVKPAQDGQSTLFVKTPLKGGAAETLWEALEERCPFHNILRG